jgi:hypothetical protein
MKIGFIEPGLHVCGGIRRIVETATRLVSFGHEVIVFTPKGSRCTWLPFTATPKRLDDIKREPLDVVIFNLAEQYKHALVSKAKKKAFWVLAPEALYKIPDIPLKALQQPFYFIANSEFTVDYIKQRRPDLKQEIPIIPGGINPQHFRYLPEIQKIYDVMYYGSARPWKGATIVENAIRSTGGNLKVMKMEGLNTPQTRMYLLYNQASCYVSAGQIEGFGFPILEAMACGCPVICTDDGGSRDFVKDGHNALVVLRSSTGISNGIKRMLGNTELRRKLRNNGLATVAGDKYNWDVVTHKFEDVLAKLVNEQ